MSEINIVEPIKNIVQFKDTFQCLGNTVFIEDENYDLALKGSGDKDWIDEKIEKNPNYYNVGLIRRGEFNARQSGRLGEIAWKLITGLDYDWKYKKNGDDGDFIFNQNNCTIDIKVQSEKLHHMGYVMGFTEEGYRKELKSDFYVFAFIDTDYQRYKQKSIPVCFVGWQTKEFILSRPLEPSLVKKSNHFNYYIQYYRKTESPWL